MLLPSHVGFIIILNLVAIFLFHLQQGLIYCRQKLCISFRCHHCSFYLACWGGLGKRGESKLWGEKGCILGDELMCTTLTMFVLLAFFNLPAATLWLHQEESLHLPYCCASKVSPIIVSLTWSLGSGGCYEIFCDPSLAAFFFSGQME